MQRLVAMLSAGNSDGSNSNGSNSNGSNSRIERVVGGPFQERWSPDVSLIRRPRPIGQLSKSCRRLTPPTQGMLAFLAANTVSLRPHLHVHSYASI